VQGDDTRRVDWKVFGKTDRYYIREYEEETSLRATLLVDISGSMDYAREGGISKCQYAMKLAACIAQIIIRQSDSVGMVTFDDQVRSFIPPRSSTSHLRLLYQTMIESRPGGETDLATIFQKLMPRLQRRGMIFIFTDGFSDQRALLQSLSHFRQASHEVVLFHILDPDEIEFPFSAWTKFENLEMLGTFRTLDPASFRVAYLDNLRQFREALKTGCQRHRIDLVPMNTSEPITDALARCLRQRQLAA
jgi:uncharacterized protein (DUF58 family)